MREENMGSICYPLSVYQGKEERISKTHQNWKYEPIRTIHLSISLLPPILSSHLTTISSSSKI